MKKIRSRSPSQSGSTLILLALFTTILVGFSGLCVDYGLMTYDVYRTQTTANAAALAGASMLKKTTDTTDTNNAYLRASNIAFMRGFPLARSQVTFTNSNARIRVEPTMVRQFYFGQVLGFTSALIDRHGSAESTPVMGLSSGGSPLAINSTLVSTNASGDSCTVTLVRHDKTDFTTATIVALSTDGNPSKSVSAWGTELKYGTTNPMMVGASNCNSLNASISTESNNLEDNLENDANSRIARARLAPWNDTGSNYTFPNYPSNDPRIMMIAVCDDSPQSVGTSYFPIKKMVPIYLVDTGAGGTTMTFKILPSLAVNSANVTSSVLGDASSTNSNLRVLRLVDDIGR